MRPAAPGPARALGWAALLAAAAWALAATSPDLTALTSAAADPARAVTESGVDRTVVALLALCAWACLAWLVLGTALSLLAHVPGRLGRLAGAVADAVTPVLVRQAVGAALGVSTLAGVVVPTAASAAAPASAVPAAAAAPVPALAVGLAPAVDRPGVAARPAHPAPSHLPTVDRPGAGGPVGAADGRETRTPAPVAPRRTPSAAPGLVTTTPSRAGAAPEVAVVVHRGDTLWSIAARHLGPQATPADVARAWPAWHVANRHVIGPDPDRLLPGQRLQPPA